MSEECVKRCISCGKAFGHIAYTPDSHCDECGKDVKIRSNTYEIKQLKQTISEQTELINTERIINAKLVAFTESVIRYCGNVCDDYMAEKARQVLKEIDGGE